MTKNDIHSKAYEFFAFYYGKSFIVPVDNKKTNKQKVYCIDRNGEVLFTLPANCFPWDYSYGNIVRISDLISKKYALFDDKGKNLTGFVYDEIFYNTTHIYSCVKKDGKYGFIDCSGKERISCTYDDAGDVLDNDSFAIVKNDGKWGCVDINNNGQIPFEYDDLFDIKDSVLLAKKGEKYGLINIFNEVLCDFKFENIYFCWNNMYFACYEGKYGIIDKFGNVILDFKYDDGFRCGTENEFSIIERNNKYAFYNNLKKEFLTGFDFDCDNDFEDSYYPLSSCGKHSAFPVRKNGRWAFMDFYGNMLTDFIYSGASMDFSENVCVVGKDGKRGAVDIYGNLVIPCRYDFLSCSRDGVLYARISEKEGCINHKNETVIPFGKYCNYAVLPFQDGIGRVVDEHGKKQYIKTNGEIIEIKIK